MVCCCYIQAEPPPPPTPLHLPTLLSTVRALRCAQSPGIGWKNNEIPFCGVWSRFEISRYSVSLRLFSCLGVNWSGGSCISSSSSPTPTTITQFKCC